MHYEDPMDCVPITICYGGTFGGALGNNTFTPATDDMDSLLRLYPASNNPQPSGRIYGSVYFTDASGNAVQPMQGVNVVARLMVNGQPSRQRVASSSLDSFSAVTPATSSTDTWTQRIFL